MVENKRATTKMYIKNRAFGGSESLKKFTKSAKYKIWLLNMKKLKTKIYI